MQTTIRVRLSEMNPAFLDKLRTALGKLSAASDPEIEITLQEQEYNPSFVKMIQASSREITEGQSVVFTMDTLHQLQSDI
jgi:hypothetical protein